MQPITVVVIAGGVGSRLGARTSHSPKCLVSVCGTPVLDLQLRLFHALNVSKVFLLCGHRASDIVDYCGDGRKWNLSLRTFIEAKPRGTAGGLLDVLDQLPEHFVIVYGDLVFDVDLQRMLAVHLQSDADATLFLHPTDHPADSDLADITFNGLVSSLSRGAAVGAPYRRLLANAGIYVLRRDALRRFQHLEGAIDFAEHIFPSFITNKCAVRSYRSLEYVKDMGTPDRLAAIEQDVLANLPGSRSLRHPRPAVFLDRDGTLIRNVPYLSKRSEVALLPGVSGALLLLRNAGYRLVVVTNQPVVARGDCNEAVLHCIHLDLETALADSGAFLDAILYCPHHPHGGFPGEVSELKVTCDCRKPGIAMISRAQRDLNIDLSKSWLIGDSQRDVDTAIAAGVTPILITPGPPQQGPLSPLSVFSFKTILDAAHYILAVSS